GREFESHRPDQSTNAHSGNGVGVGISGGGTMTTGVLQDSALRAMLAAGQIAADPAATPEQIQPASLDLRLGTVAYRIRASFLAGKGRRVDSRLAEFEMHRMDLTA